MSKSFEEIYGGQSLSERPLDIPRGYCHCGCGQKTNVILKNDPPTGRVKGEYSKFIRGHSTAVREGNCQGHRYNHVGTGYILVKCTGHPRADRCGNVYEHIIVIEKAIGRFIEASEAIHHLDGNKANNSIGNLILFKTHVMHHAYEHRLKIFAACGHYDWRKCCFCHIYDKPEKLVKHCRGHCHVECRREYDRKRRPPGSRLLGKTIIL